MAWWVMAGGCSSGDGEHAVQALLPQRIANVHDTLERRKTLWEQSLLAIAVGQFERCWLCRRLASKLCYHGGFVWFTTSDAGLA